ncbi:MAG: exodeoxyribonuclease VII large subunit [Actinomycetaceae bacterium]|nr:exodeoxyribonuclease VII large subunit [Actinomycetaceae bacterium]
MTAPTARETTRENPWPLALLSSNIRKYVDRMSPLWVEGQVVEYKQRPNVKMAFFVLRDVNEQTSMTVKCFSHVLRQTGSAFDEGARVVVLCKPDFYEGNGQLSLFAKEIHIAGTGNLLEQIEQLRRRLHSEGLFDDRHKKPLPFLPRKIGLICGANAKAKDDVIINARTRWPGALFEVKEVPVQGIHCVDAVTHAIAELDDLDDIDLIVVARGGGSVEELLPFSDEKLVRAAFSARTALVSAIGHEADCPLLDFVADYRASTPTDAARRIVPDVTEEKTTIKDAYLRLHQSILQLIHREDEQLHNLVSRPVVRDPSMVVSIHKEHVQHLIIRLRQSMTQTVALHTHQISGLVTTLRALSPYHVFERGFSVVRTASGTVIDNASDISKGELLEVIFHRGSAVVKVAGTNPDATFSKKENS